MKICLITNAHISYNPRLLKEADALYEAGHEVRVIAVINDPSKCVFDEKILSVRKWKCKRLLLAKKSFRGFLPWFLSGIRAKFWNWRALSNLDNGIAEKAFSRYFTETLKEAVSEPADLFIAHNLQSLPVAAIAAEKMGGRYAFDVEDYHWDEDSLSSYDPDILRTKRYIMEKYIGGCACVTATSEVMARTLENQFQIRKPVAIYNVFPISYAESLKPPDQRGRETGHSISFYWFSQMIGFDRGLDDFLKAMPLLDQKAELYLRGHASNEAKQKLLGLLPKEFAEQIHFLPSIFAEDIVRDAANYDVGLALEQPVSQSRLLTVTNKLFVYMLSGLMIAATDTPGQREVLSEMDDDNVILYKPGEFRELAAQINQKLKKEQLLKSKQKAWEQGHEKFNWDLEKIKLLNMISESERTWPSKPRLYS